RFDAAIFLAEELGPEKRGKPVLFQNLPVPFGFESALSKEKALFSLRAKIVKPSGEKPDKFQSGISWALLELRMTLALKAQLRELNITAAMETEVGGGQKATIIFRRILSKQTRKSRTKNKQKCPRSSTPTAVHDAILYGPGLPKRNCGQESPCETAGNGLIKVRLDKVQQNNTEHKVETFSGVYKKLKGKDVNFEFPDFQL
ncbi:hypothetical protein P7K49_015046, partial [Saguinus oedipus]